MLKQLTIANIVLIESIQLEFQSGLNALTGETGAGKSSIISALRLILGDRSDFSQIRKGCEKAQVTALFDIQHHHELLEKLHQLGIDHEDGDPLIIKRELTRNSKSRCFVNHQAVQRSLLEMIGKYLISHVHQMAYVELFDVHTHLEMLDTFAEIRREEFATEFEQFIALQKELKILQNETLLREAKKERLISEIEEIQKFDFDDEEDEALFAKFKESMERLTSYDKIIKITESLFEGKYPILNLLHKNCLEIESLATNITSLNEVHNSLKNIIVELQDNFDILLKLQRSLDVDPKDIERMEIRLDEINKIKKKYGATASLVQKHLSDAQSELIHIQLQEERLLHIEDLLPTLKISLDEKASLLTYRRNESAKELKRIITEELSFLNMPKAIFEIAITPSERTSTGDDRVEFLFAPNTGEKMLSLKDSASGGELSRVLLALKAALAKRERISTLIFDEIDAHLGGITATIVGEKIQEISHNRQVLCITHLPQVAKFANNHLFIIKNEKDGRTYTQAHTLDEKGRLQEMDRMLGKKT